MRSNTINMYSGKRTETCSAYLLGVLKGIERYRRPHPMDARLADAFAISVVSIIDEAKVTSDFIIVTDTYDSDRTLTMS